MPSIEVGKMFQLVAQIKVDMAASGRVADAASAGMARAEASLAFVGEMPAGGQEACVAGDGSRPADAPMSASDDELDITSHQIQRYLIDERIVPHRHQRYKHYFSDQPATIALTYEWNTSFRQLRAFLNDDSVRLHNRKLDPSPGLVARLYLKLFVWVVAGPLGTLPGSMEKSRMFIDVLINDQTNKQIAEELAEAERTYRGARYHVVASSRRVIQRAWCLYELGVRREAWKRSVFLYASGDGSEGMEQLETLHVGCFEYFFGLYCRGCLNYMVGGVCHLVVWSMWGNRRFLSSISSAMSQAHATGRPDDYFDKMEASFAEDLEAIKKKLIDAYGAQDDFNRVIRSCLTRSSSNAMAMTAAAWFEAVLWMLMVPMHMVSFWVGLVLAALPCNCEFDDHAVGGLFFSKWLGYSSFTNVILSVVFLPVLLPLIGVAKVFWKEVK